MGGGDQGTVLLGGALNLLILKALSTGEMHGYGVARWVETVTDDALRVEEGSLYPALHRLHQQGLVEGRWGRSENGRRARFYGLTSAGRDRLRTEGESWTRLSDAMVKVLATEPGGTR